MSENKYTSLHSLFMNVLMDVGIKILDYKCVGTY